MTEGVDTLTGVDVEAGSPPQTSSRSLFAAAFRSSPGRHAFWLLAVVAVLNVVVRPMPWRFDWTWALVQFGYVTIVTTPIVAGIAAFEASDRSASADLIDAAGGTRRSLWLDTLTIWLWSLIGVSAGLVVTCVVAAGATGALPSPRALLTLVPVLVMYAAAAAVGAAFGWWIRHWSATLVAAVTVFFASILAFTSGNEILVRTGGATDDLTGLRLDLGWWTRQVLWLAAATILFVEFAAARPRMWIPRALIRPAVISVAVVATAAVATTGANMMFEPTSVDLSCVGTPQICVTDPYLDRAEELRPQINDALAIWESAGGPPPQKYSQAGAPPAKFTVSIPGPVLRGDRQFDPNLILNAWEAKQDPLCFEQYVFTDPTLDEQETSLRYWLSYRAGLNSVQDAPWADMTDVEQQQWARTTLDQISAACTQGA